MTPKQAAEQLLAMAEETQTTGQIPLAGVMTLLAAIEGGEVTKTAAMKTADSLVLWANAMRQNPNRRELAARLRGLIGQEIQATPAQVAATIYQTASSREQVMDGFAKANPSMTDEQLEKAADMWEKHKDSLKKAHEAEPVLAAAPAEISDSVYDRHVDGIEKALKDIKHHLSKSADKRPTEDIATLFNEIRQTASSMCRRMGKQATREFWKPVMNEEPKKIGVAWVRPGNQRDGEAHAFQEATFDDGSTVVDHTSLCGKKFQSSAISKARAYGNTSSETCEDCKRKAGSKTASDDEHVSKFEEGKPADPTENMSDEDKSTWWKKHEENKDNFKSASATWKKSASANPWKVNAAINIRNRPLGEGVTLKKLG